MEDKQTRLMLILATVLVALVAVIRFAEPAKDEDEAADKPKPEDVVTLDAAQIAGLSLTTEEGTMNAVLEDNVWQITAPFSARGDEEAIGGILDAVDRMKAEPPIEGADPAKYGLDKPRAVLELRFKDGSKHTLDVGMDSPVGYKSYIRWDGSAVRVASSKPGTAIVQSFSAFKDRSVWNPPTELAAISWTASEGAWSVKLVDGIWRFADGRRAKADQIAALQASVARLRFESLVDAPDRAALGLETPRGELRIEGGGADAGKTGVLRFGVKDDSGAVLEAPSGVVGRLSDVGGLELTVGELLEDRLLPVDPSTLASLRIEQGSTSHVWEQGSGVWKKDGAEDPAANAVASRFVAEAIVDRAATPAAPTETWATVTAMAGGKAVVVRIGQEVEGGRTAQEGDSPPFLVSKELVATLSDPRLGLPEGAENAPPPGMGGMEGMQGLPPGIDLEALMKQAQQQQQ